MAWALLAKFLTQLAPAPTPNPDLSRRLIEYVKQHKLEHLIACTAIDSSNYPSFPRKRESSFSAFIPNKACPYVEIPQRDWLVKGGLL
jgi:hypothetical protein